MSRGLSGFGILPRMVLANDNYILKKNECVGYKVPLFLNGEDEIENLEF